METTLKETKISKKFDGFGDDLFSIIPGFKNASEAPQVNASDLNEKNFNENWVKPNRPCVIKGAVKDWPATQKFNNKDYWLSVCDDFKIKIYPHMNHNNSKRHKIDAIDTSFHDGIKRLFKNEDYILSFVAKDVTTDNHFSVLIKEMPGFSFLSNNIKPRRYIQRRFFIYRRSSTAWHYHPIDETLMCQVIGTKKVMLLPPDMPNAKIVSDFLFYEDYIGGKLLDSSIELKPMIAYVEQGDALYIPPYWHHGVVPVDGEIGFTYAYCWKSPLYKFGKFSNYFVRKFYKDSFRFQTKSLVLPILAIVSGFLYSIRKITQFFTKKAY